MILKSNLNKCIRLSFLLFLSTLGYALQAQEAVSLNGKIEAGDSNIEKIHIINLSLEKGAVTDAEGNFQLIANLNDSLYVSSVQFENKSLVVTGEMIRTKSLRIKLQDKVNELAEVMIDDIKLSGHLASDLSKISIADVEAKYKLQNDLNTFIRKDREMNPYENTMVNGGIRLDKIAGAVMERISKDRAQPVHYSPRELANKSISIVGHEFFREDLNLAENEICNFVYFCAEDSQFRKLVINNNAFVLIEYFETKIDDFRNHRGAILNTTNQIPG
jgi:hypothetical protein